MARGKKRADGLYQRTFRIKIRNTYKKYTVYGHSEQELSQKENAKREQIKKGLEKYNNPTVAEYYERWSQGRIVHIAPSTYRTQDKIFGLLMNIEIHNPTKIKFGQIKMRDVDIVVLRELQMTLKDSRKSRTVNDYIALIKHLFSDAYKERVIEYNPCLLINNYKITEERARDTHHRALSLEEQKKFFECERCKNSFYYNVFCFAISTGMRIGEIGALMMSDIRNDIIHVERTITRTETGSYKVGDNAKTEAGRRIIPITDQIQAIITRQQEQNTLLHNRTNKMNGLLFSAVEGGLLMATPIDRELKRICKIVEIEPFTMHALRDTFATRAIESGMNPKTLQEILGHSDFSITMNLYGHCLPNTKKTEMDAVNIVI
jgi:integrase